MPVDLYKSGDHYVLLADLPGVDPGSVDVSIDNGTLTVTAERTARTEEGVQWLTSERFAGRFRRQVSLGEGIDTEGISASYDNGVLSVVIPVAERAKPRRVEISRKDEQQQASIEATAS
nr:Hsp20/alpha crystallin family protein [Auraticoccus cholistanensis]